jgi:UDP-3-O-[3-hydroxymyristoyl] glucosamine N-acyltransferase
MKINHLKIGQRLGTAFGAVVLLLLLTSVVAGSRLLLQESIHDAFVERMVALTRSARIGDRVVMAGQCGVNDNIFVGDDVIAGGATKIFTNAPAGRVLLGYPAVKMETHIEIQKALRRLPRLAATVAALQKAISKPTETD